MKKEINLEEIFNNNFDCYTELLVEWKEIEETAMSKERFKITVMEVIKQVLDLASENGKVAYVSDRTNEKTWLSTTEKKHYVLDKQSITDTINQVEL